MVNDLALAERSAAPETDMQIEEAWYVLTLLLRMGRPAAPAEIVRRLRLVPASAEFLGFLCRIPNSPLSLTDGGYLTVSREVSGALSRLAVFGAVPERVPRFIVGFTGLKRVWDAGDLFLRYSSRKRKDRGPLPKPKRRSMLCHGNVKPSGTEEMEAAECTSHLLTLANVGDHVFEDEVRTTTPDTMIQNNLPIHVAVVEYASRIVEEGGQLTISLLTDDTALCYADEMACEETRCVDVDKFSKSTISSGHQLILNTEIKLDTPTLFFINGDNCITTATEMMVRNEVKSINSASLEDCQKQTNEESGNHCRIALGPIVNDYQGQDPAKKDLVKFGSLGDALDVLASPASNMEAVATAQSSEAFNAQKQKETLCDKPVGIIPSSAGLLDASGTENNNRSKKTLPEDQEDGKFNVKKLKRNPNNKMVKKENKVMVSKFPKNQVESNKFPDFESFILEEEEGSGGYGTVYRARRKKDGKTLAIKCPHPNAHPYHVSNELKMLERFGGRSFVIKYEGSFKSGKSECFILEHVEHDRPEVLKKEIDVSEIQWYGFCMFRALSSLHKQGIVHRDVKPGNFLFSRKLNKGYLIDFNLALDLNNKQRPGGKSYATSHRSSEQISYQYRAMPSAKAKKSATVRNSEVYNKEPAKKADKASGKTLLSKYINKAGSKGPDAFSDLDCRNKYGIQVADGSGITSAKDVTSTRTPSADRPREPIPCCGRKELINLVQEVMQSPSQNSLTIPASQRKRIAAPLGRVERRLAILTPMPLLSNGISFYASEKKHKNEGSCVGTKGFRAPEVLLKSIYQSCKIDIWSAGVTLLYLMIGRTPFGGDPDQNMKEIAKLRGSEDLWEVAKLHNRESSFPMELYDIQSLETTKLRDWCEKNTKRVDFLDRIPSALFDLVEKCLTVNPRLRISADEALMHDFFSPCRDSLRKQRMLRQNVGSETGSQSQTRASFPLL